MSDPWQLLAIYPDPVSAGAAAGLLRSESVPVRILLDEPVPGLMKGCSLMVLSRDLARAQALFSLAPLTDEEWAQYVDDPAADENDDRQDRD